MALQFPPAGSPAWFRYAMQTANQHDVDIKRLWNEIPQIPDPHAGIAYTGPILPTLFLIPSSKSSGLHNVWRPSSTSSGG